MKITSGELAEIKDSLKRLRELAPTLPLDQRIFGDGTTIGQIAFHSGESADFWLRAFVLKEKRIRVRDDEFRGAHDTAQIDASLAAAMDACDVVAADAPEGDAVISVPTRTHNGGSDWTVALALLHIATHTAEHLGQLSVAAEIYSAPEA